MNTPISSAADAREILLGLALHSRLQTVIRRDKARKVTALTALSPQFIMFEDPNAIPFLNGAAQTGDFRGIPRTYGISLRTDKPDEIRKICDAFGAVVESMELIEQPPEKLLTEIAEENPEVCYDETCFIRTCAALGHEADAKSWTKKLVGKETNRNIVWIVMKTVPASVILHRKFLLQYIECFNNMMATA
jgi:hypothetical protein